MMHRGLFLLPALLMALLASGQSGRFTLRNASGVARTGDPFILTRQSLRSICSIPGAEEGKVPVLSADGKEIPCQTDDLNGDGVWDELVFQVTMERNTSLSFRIRWTPAAKAPVFTGQTRARLGVRDQSTGKYSMVREEIRPDGWTKELHPGHYQLGGPVWENDKIAFRNFFDARNTTHILGKTTGNLIADTLAAEGASTERMQPWGMLLADTLPSLGAGGFALMLGERPVALRETESASYRLIADGPVRSVFELVYEGWKVAGQSYNVRHRISIWAGKYGYSAELTFTGLANAGLLAVGTSVAGYPGQALQQSNTPRFASLCSHGKRGGGAGFVGTGILFHKKDFKGYGETPSPAVAPKGDTISHSRYALLHIRGGEPLEYWFFAGWEKTSERFSSSRYFLDMVQEEADRREHPLSLIPD